MLNYNSLFLYANTTEIEIKDLFEEYQEKSFFYRFSMNNLIGIGFYTNEPIYTFDMTNISMLESI